MKRLYGYGQGLRALTILLVVVLGVSPPLGGASAAAPNEKTYYVAPTGHTLGAPFLGYWTEHEGRNTIGLPVSEPQTRTDGITQYFEQGVLVIAAGADPATAHVRRIEAGAVALTVLHDPDRAVAGRRVGGLRQTAAFKRAKPKTSSSDCTYVSESGHNVCGAIKTYYDRKSGAARFGSPLTETYSSGNVRVQWFEYGRIQVPRDDSDEAAAAPVGVELAADAAVGLRPVPRGKLPLLDLNRYRLFDGDGTVPEAVRRFVPQRILMPAIDVDASIEQVDVVDGVMGVPADAWNVGWYPAFGQPGDNSNVVMSGHKDWWGIGPTVFWDLEQLVEGDRIYVVGRDGAGFTYAVTSTWWAAPRGDSAAVLGDTGVEAITLITCTGDFTGTAYVSRLIVRAERI